MDSKMLHILYFWFKGHIQVWSSLVFVEIANLGHILVFLIFLFIRRACVSNLFIVLSLDGLAYWSNLGWCCYVQWNRKARLVSVLLSYVWRIVPPQWNIHVVPVHQLKNHCKVDAHSVGCIMLFYLPSPCFSWTSALDGIVWCAP